MLGKADIDTGRESESYTNVAPHKLLNTFYLLEIFRIVESIKRIHTFSL